MPYSKLEKTYDSSIVECKWYDHWLSKDYFKSDSSSGKEPYTIVIPPPNVTGMLTVGHVLNNTIQDILIRKARMEGKEACWVPGTDHASIATEAKVVAMLKEKGIDKNKLTREQFLSYVWEWKNKYGGIIINQLKKLGCSCDWSRERFTMDQDYSNSVLHAFVLLYEKGLIYRGHRLVNWCPISKSAISDEEVFHREKKGSLWYFRYPVLNLNKYVVVATTRPETMLGDTAVAVHPDDSRYEDLIGETIILPLVGREIPIIADKYVDPNFGTGCVKVTPAHDPNDFSIGERHNLEFINIMNPDASLNVNVPRKYQGLSREDGRKMVVQDLDSKGLIQKVEDYVNKVGYSERGNVPIEFYMSKQWFIKMKELSKPAMEAIQNKKISFHPSHWTKTYEHWMNNIKDWCVSRQLWWGHQIPVWYHNDDESKVHVSIDGPKDPENWNRDPDVLDTWASSWIWPLGVYGWPKDNEELNKFYPTDTLVTGPDIIFFWVARMIMSGYEFQKQKPFSDVYFTSILRDSTGKKLSKSLGNSPDPIELFDEFGTDAVRFGIMLMSPQGLDVLFSKSRLEIGRNFMNKLWNACRFIQLNLNENEEINDSIKEIELDLTDKWILSRLSMTVADYNKQLDRFHFNEAAKVLYEFIWSDFCDWYLEIAKTRFRSNDDLSMNSKIISMKCIRTILVLLHPFAPFITEELWVHFKTKGSKDLIISSWIKKENLIDISSEKTMNILKELITSVRSIRSRMNIPPSKLSNLHIRCTNDQKVFLNVHLDLFKSMAKIDDILIGVDIEKPKYSATVVSNGMELYILLEGLVDLTGEIQRMNKRMSEVKRLLLEINTKLTNQNFLTRAPEYVIKKEKSNQNKLKEELEKLTSNLEMLN